MKKKLREVYKHEGQDKLLARFSLFLFNRPRTIAILWLCLTLFGLASYTMLLKREGFPSVNVPFSVVSGTYFVNDAEKVDAEVTKPISDIVLQDKRVKSVGAQAQGTFYSIFVQYTEDTDATQAGQELQQRIEQAGVLPDRATARFETPKFGFTERGDDMVISVYAKEGRASIQQLNDEAESVRRHLQAQGLADIESISVVPSFVEGVDATNGHKASNQTHFDRYGERVDGQNKFYDAVSLGISQKDGTDVIDLNEQVQTALEAYNRTHQTTPYRAVISATYAHDIQDQISGLQKALLEGLLAVLVVGSVVIAIRASIITVLAMLSVLAITLGVIYAVGYTLNTITLFSLILCLGLIVDDTIIMVEALDAQRRRRKDPQETVRVATRKVSRAMVAATTTAILSFAPLLFVGGILGNFIRAIPITVITSLAVSLLVALIFIPLFARYLLLGKKQMGAKNVSEPAAGIEAKVAAFVCRPMLWARHSWKRLFAVGGVAVVIGFVFIAAAGGLFQQVAFNIFPPSKDGNGMSVQLTFKPGTSIQTAQATADRANGIVGATLGENFKTAAYYTNASNQNANLTVYLVSFKEREPTAPELERLLERAFRGFEGAAVEVTQMDVGPPAAPFNVRIQTDDREAALRLAKDIEVFLSQVELVRPSGQRAEITRTAIGDPATYARADGKAYVAVNAVFRDTDTSTLVTLAQSAINKEFTAEKLATYGLSKDVLQYDIGQEQENQDSFKTLALAFPILLLVIYLLLSIQFRSLLQPLLIFLAIPFSLFGIALGLYVTDNAFSFFSMLGFFALLGLSIKNTILLTDYANQLRRAGKGAIDAAVGALEERFRPLIATSLTAVVSLIPLSLSDPFWEGLTVVLIFGLLSSTFLVITVFPYYYLGAEYLRLRISRKDFLIWLGWTIGISVACMAAGIAPVIIPAIALGVLVVRRYLGGRQRSSA